MKSNKIIAIVVIVAGLAGSIYMLYLTFSSVSNSNGAPVVIDLGSGQSTGLQNNILPFGTNFDTSAINKYNSTQKIFPYPTVNKSDIGYGQKLIE